MSKKDSNQALLKFLFDESQQDAELDSYLDKLAEEMAWQKELETRKAPLQKALQSIDIPTKGLTMDPDRGFVLTLDSAEEYKKASTTLRTPDGMHALVELGWLSAVMGDVAGTEAEGVFKINFIGVTGDDDPSDVEKAADLEKSDIVKIEKDSLEFVNEPLSDREDIKATDDDQKGMSKAQPGKDPEGTPKGSRKNESARVVARKLLQERLDRPVGFRSPRKGGAKA